jgi:ADP-heptose:LPS heptosyltransferase
VLRQADLPLVAGILEGALLYLGHDSGITHLAAAVGAPTVAVFGPTDPRVWRPRGPRVRVLGGTAVTPGQVAPTAWPEADAVIAAAVDLLTRR